MFRKAYFRRGGDFKVLDFDSFSFCFSFNHYLPKLFSLSHNFLIRALTFNFGPKLLISGRNFSIRALTFNFGPKLLISGHNFSIRALTFNFGPKLLISGSNFLVRALTFLFEPKLKILRCQPIFRVQQTSSSTLMQFNFKQTYLFTPQKKQTT